MVGVSGGYAPYTPPHYRNPIWEGALKCVKYGRTVFSLKFPKNFPKIKSSLLINVSKKTKIN